MDEEIITNRENYFTYLHHCELHSHEEWKPSFFPSSIQAPMPSLGPWPIRIMWRAFKKVWNCGPTPKAEFFSFSIFEVILDFIIYFAFNSTVVKKTYSTNSIILYLLRLPLMIQHVSISTSEPCAFEKKVYSIFCNSKVCTVFKNNEQVRLVNGLIQILCVFTDCVCCSVTCWERVVQISNSVELLFVSHFHPVHFIFVHFEALLLSTILFIMVTSLMKWPFYYYEEAFFPLW